MMKRVKRGTKNILQVSVLGHLYILILKVSLAKTNGPYGLMSPQCPLVAPACVARQGLQMSNSIPEVTKNSKIC